MRTGVFIQMEREWSRINGSSPRVNTPSSMGIPVSLTNQAMVFAYFYCQVFSSLVLTLWPLFFSITNWLIFTLESSFSKTSMLKNFQNSTELSHSKCPVTTSTEWRWHSPALTGWHSPPHAVHWRLLPSKRNFKFAPLKIFPWNKIREYQLLPTLPSSRD